MSLLIVFNAILALNMLFNNYCQNELSLNTFIGGKDHIPSFSFLGFCTQ